MTPYQQALVIKYLEQQAALSGGQTGLLPRAGGAFIIVDKKEPRQ